MDLDTVSGLVAALISTYHNGLEFYTQWQRKRREEDNYASHAKGRQSSSRCCGLSTSLSFSAPRIREAFDSGANLLGDSFSAGDEKCRSALTTNLRQLEIRVHVLHNATRGESAPMGLFAIIRASEDVRVSTIRALSDQYQRLAAGRPVPNELSATYRPPQTSKLPPDDTFTSLGSIPGFSEARSFRANNLRRPRSIITPKHIAMTSAIMSEGDNQPSRTSSPRRSRFLALPMDTILDDRAMSVSPGKRQSGFLSEPPSPPLTPTKTHRMSDELLSPRSIRSSVSSQSMRSSIFVRRRSRPVTSVFSLFCPEAMRVQLDPARSVSNRTCKCGHDMSSRSQGATKLKDGFHLTPRFLAKSHYVGSGFGCVLCISTGKMGTYEDVEALREHINATHDKWQMLHDRDMMAC